MVLCCHPLVTWADLCLTKEEEVEGTGEVALEIPSGKAKLLYFPHFDQVMAVHAAAACLPSYIMQADVGDVVSQHQQESP